MLVVFILLGLAMFCVIKFCKKTLRIVLTIILIVATLYGIGLSMEQNRVYALSEPIFAVSSELKEYENYSREVYKGLWYRIEVDRVENQKVIASTMYFFNKIIAGAIE